MDLWIAVILGTAAAALTFFIANTDSRLFGSLGWDFWFETDLRRELMTLTDRRYDNYRTSVHPIYPLLTGVPTIALSRLTGSREFAVTFEMAAVSFFAAALLYSTLRLAGAARSLSVACVALYCASGGFLFFHGVATTYALGGATMVLALAMGTEPLCRRPIPHVIAGSLTLGVTVTNWVASLATSWACYRPREAVRLALGSFLIVALLAAVQSNIFSRSGPFMQVVGEGRYTVPLDGSHLRNVAIGLFVHSIVAPHAQLQYGAEVDSKPLQRIMTAQGTGLPSDLVGRLALIGWALLLALGIWGAMRSTVARSFRWPLLLTIAAQFLIYLTYGRETFLYAAHVAPLFVMLAALGFATPARRVMPALTIITAVLCAQHNAGEFRHARQLHEAYLADPSSGVLPEAP